MRMLTGIGSLLGLVFVAIGLLEHDQVMNRVGAVTCLLALAAALPRELSLLRTLVSKLLRDSVRPHERRRIDWCGELHEPTQVACCFGCGC
jgi:hypothetical protein